MNRSYLKSFHSKCPWATLTYLLDLGKSRFYADGLHTVDLRFLNLRTVVHQYVSHLAMHYFSWRKTGIHIAIIILLYFCLSSYLLQINLYICAITPSETISNVEIWLFLTSTIMKRNPSFDVFNVNRIEIFCQKFDKILETVYCC